LLQRLVRFQDTNLEGMYDQAKMRDIPLVWLSVTLMEYQAPHADFESSQ